ncbi:hypothetical protein MAPG_09104 [Magnaporthiopsis poae ATCC 64411]|uniref:Uncharacterized protein n=1 Tax=Magnaporthiopsis poae (strain ATCC 64411 / 73-15) TaxID=644358 RepID=A0A0C4E927_MAGP6|nr:hypothetical protein MAPG_09104 [Magnaporthiopsis poae ATCC 64411]
MSEPPGTAYTLGSLFDHPVDGGSKRAVAVQAATANTLVALFSVIVTLGFIAGWKVLSHTLAICFPDEVDFVAQRKGWSGLSTFLTELLTMKWDKAAVCSCTPSKPGASSRYIEAILVLIALTFFVGSVTAGIMVPPLLIIGTTAPAQPDAVYFPVAPLGMTAAEASRHQALFAPAAMRALGGVSAAQASSAGQVSVRRVTVPAGNKPKVRVDYSYSITGKDFGLQKLSRLRHAVEGSCVTEYGWLSSTEEIGDFYNLWGISSEAKAVYRTEVSEPPWASMHLHPDTQRTTVESGNNSFAVVVHSAGRASYTTTLDPWYATYLPIGNDSTGQIRVQPGRPPLSCWQKDSWSLNGQTVDGVFAIDDLPGLNLPESWHVLLQRHFAAPKIVDIGISLDRAVLVSSTTSLNGVFNAEASNLFDDMRRLVWAAFVASRDAFKDTTMTVERFNIHNAATGPEGTPADRVAEFVLVTSAVAALSVEVLVAVPVICFIFIIAATSPVLKFVTGLIKRK